MKSMTKILSHYVLSAAGVALILLVVNFAAVAAWTAQSDKDILKHYDIEQIADSLVRTGNCYTLSGDAKSRIAKGRLWAMLIDNNSGRVVWSMSMPGDVPESYTLSDVASFTRWYLNGYPVTVWKHQDGLFVLGEERDSVWKYSITEPMTVIDHATVWITSILILNGIAAVLLALVFGLRLFRSLKPLAKGIEDMAENKPVELLPRGLLVDLATGINTTSAQLTRQEAALKKRDDARTRWIAGVSHDIRTPLSLVMGYASQLEDDSALTQTEREQAGIIRIQSERIKSLVSDLNLASKLEYDMQPIRRKSIILSALLRQITADFINSGLSGGYSIDVIIGENAQNATVCGDEELLRRAVTNLIANSIWHNPKGCSIKITLEKGMDTCSLSVSDSGAGFAQEILDDLNDPKNSAACLESHGLGLTIVRQIIKAHGGTTTFRNLPECGCAVEVCLPVNAVDNH